VGASGCASWGSEPKLNVDLLVLLSGGRDTSWPLSLSGPSKVSGVLGEGGWGDPPGGLRSIGNDGCRVGRAEKLALGSCFHPSISIT